MAELKLFTFGPPRLEFDGQPIDVSLRKALALLIYLTVTAQPQRRDTLATLLWPDSDEREARGRLRRTLHRLRDQLGEVVMATSSDMISLNPAAHVCLDCTMFLEHAASALQRNDGAHLSAENVERLQAAAALYTDDFLAGWTVPETTAFDEWQFFERERLRHILAQVLAGLVQSYATQNAWDAAIPYARRWVALDPLHEPAQRHLMMVYAWSGQQSAAIRQYGEYVRILDAELGAVPDDETTALYDDIRFRRFPPQVDGTSPHPRSGATEARPKPYEYAISRSAATSPKKGDDATQAEKSTPDQPPFVVPQPPTPLVSRIDELESICTYLRDRHVRAVTIVGIGGVGKTRLALEVAHTLRGEFIDGVYFVELAALNHATLVADAIAQALGVKECAGQTISATLQAHLRAKHLLLVLDNFEHVVNAAPFVAELLATCPTLSVLVTSRAALNIRAEQQFRLEPLSDTDAVQLFVQRAQAAGAVLTANDINADLYSAICQRLDRLPLAIELIAIRARTLAPRELLGLLERPLQALVRGPRDVPVRHQALHNAIQWSYDLLDVEERRVFVGLGVFVGGCSVEAVQAVLGDSVSVLPMLETLYEASLLQQQVVADETRFLMLETIREFAIEQLKMEDGHLWGELSYPTDTGSGSEHLEQPATVNARALRLGHLSIQHRHAEYFLRLLEQALPELAGSRQTQWPQWLKAELPNLRVALQTLIEAQDEQRALHLVSMLWKYWSDQGYLNEGREWINRTLTLTSTTQDAAMSIAHHEVLLGAAFMAFVQDDYACALQRYNQLLALAQRSGQQHYIAKALNGLGILAQCIGHLDETRDLLEQSISVSRVVGDTYGEHRTLFSLAFVHAQQGEFDVARQLFERAVDFNRNTANAYGLASSLAYYAYAIAHQGDDDASVLAHEALAIGIDEGSPWIQQIALQALGLLAVYHEDYASARALFEGALAQSQRLGDRLYIAIALSYLGLIDLQEYAWSRAYDRLVEALQLARSIGSPKAIVLACEGLACLWGSIGDWERATQLFGAIEVLDRQRGVSSAPLNYKLQMPYVHSAYLDLGPQRFALAWENGQALTLEAACALASSIFAVHNAHLAERRMLTLEQIIDA